MSNAVAIHRDEGAALTDPTTGVVLHDPAIEFVQTLPQRWQLAKILHASGMSRQKTPEGVMAVILKGYELGLPPMAALSNIDFFDGNFAIRSHAQLAIASARHGVRCQTIESTATACRIRLTRPEWEPCEESFTIEEARTANLTNKDNWKKYGKDMLYNRALSRGIKRICPEVGAGVYDPDEIGATSAPSGAPAAEPARRSKRELAEDVQARAAAQALPPSSDPGDTLMPAGDYKGTPLRDVPLENLRAALEHYAGNPDAYVLVGDLEAVIRFREAVDTETGELLLDDAPAEPVHPNAQLD